MLNLSTEVVLAYPATRATNESGARRGAAFIGHGPDGRNVIKSLSGEGLLLEPQVPRGQSSSR
jgi:hypothetical protein